MIVVNLALITSVRSRDEHHPALEVLLMPPADCAMPCFLGIKIGRTHADEAIAILEAHPFVGDVQAHGTGERRMNMVRWYWAPDAPRSIAGFRDNVLELSESGVVNSISLYVFTPTGEVWRYINTHETSQGGLLSDYIRVDGPNCIYNPLHFYRAAPQRIFYMPTPSDHPIPYKPRRNIPQARQC
ncbi:MAG: hypothetical protein AAFV33_14080 [Chloroflexota bacterium]